MKFNLFRKTRDKSPKKLRMHTHTLSSLPSGTFPPEMKFEWLNSNNKKNSHKFYVCASHHTDIIWNWSVREGPWYIYLFVRMSENFVIAWFSYVLNPAKKRTFHFPIFNFTFLFIFVFYFSDRSVCTWIFPR